LIGRDPPVIELFPKEPQKLKVGESTRFSCRATSGTPYPTVVWSRRDGRPISSRFTEDYPGVITLREATFEDQGLYVCTATNIAGTTSLSTNLEILQHPTIIIMPDTQTLEITEGDELRFSCSATGVPTPSINIKVPEGSNVIPRPAVPAPARGDIAGTGRAVASIHHYNTQLSQAGLYECIATNDAGQDLRYIQVNVKEKRGDVGVGGDDRVPDGDDRRSPEWRPRPEVDDRRSPDWRPRPEVDDRRRPQPTQRPDYRPYPPPEPEGRPIDPPRGGGQQASFTVHLGERAEFNCAAEDNTMETEWRRADGRQLPRGSRIYGSQLVIEDVRNDAAGSYECLAYDSRTRRPVTLLIAQLVVVAGPPKITFSPPMPIVVKAGEDVIIYCNASGEGNLRVHWHGENGAALPRYENEITKIYMKKITEISKTLSVQLM
jgi:hypothetical protein